MTQGTTPFQARALELIEAWERTALAIAPPGCDMINVGPFRAIVHAEARDEHLNVAMVDSDPGDRAEARSHLDALRALFKSRDRELHIEYNEARWPGLAGTFDAAGLTRRASHPLMACTRETLRPFWAPRVEVRFLSLSDNDEDLAAFATIRGTDGSMEPPAGAKHVEALRNALESGRGRYALASLDGTHAGTGVLHDTAGVGEVVGIVTRETARRRGVAATVTTFLADDHFSGGGSLVFLDAEDERAVAVYRKIGFEVIGAWLFYGDGPG